MAKPRKKMFSPRDRDNLSWIWTGYLKSKTPWLAFVFMMIVAQGFVYQQFLSLTEDGLRVIFDRGNMADLIKVCLAVFGVFAFRGAMSFLIPRISAWIAADAVYKMRSDLVARLVTLDLKYFEATTSGQLIQRLVQQTTLLGAFLSQSSVKALRDLATIVIVSAYLAYQQPLLMGTAVAVVPLSIIAMQILSNRIKPLQAREQQTNAELINTIDEMVTGIRTVKISNQEEAERLRLTRVTEQIKSLTVKLETERAMILPFIDFASAFVYMLVIGFGGYMVLSPDYAVDGAGIITFLIGLVLVFDPGRRVAQFFVTIQANLVILESVREIAEQVPGIKDGPKAHGKVDPLADIHFRDVGFRYTKDRPLFQGLDMTFEGGKVTAIVGPTGSGKTSLLSLLARLYEPSQGVVSIGDVDVQDLKLQVLRDQLSVVAQDIVIFNDSILNNIRYVKPDASDAELWQAAEAAEIAPLIRERGEDPVGPKGAKLSGGQKQRIAIARALLRAAPIVLLDEATSALDQQTEERIQRALSRLTNEKTTIMVAHRLSSVVSADQIYVLEAGNVVEHGTHDSLMASKGLYHSLFDAQRSGYGD